MSAENYGWIFVERTPLLYDKTHVEKQKKIETWLDLYQLASEIQKETKPPASAQLNYIV